MRLGIIVELTDNVNSDLAKIKELGFNTCQLSCWDLKLMTSGMADKVKAAAEKYSIEITAFWCGWSGPVIWDFKSGPNTLGLVPEAYRFIRMKELINGLDFAKK